MIWRECRNSAERRKALVEALSGGRSIKAAARALGVNRQYLYELMALHRVGRPDTTDTPDITDTVGSVGLTDKPNSDEATVSVGRTSSDSLTYSSRATTLRTVMSATMVRPAEADEMVRTAIDLPKALLDWVEQLALRRKQEGILQRAAKSPIVTEALLEYKRNVEAAEVAAEAEQRAAREAEDKRSADAKRRKRGGHQ